MGNSGFIVLCITYLYFTQHANPNKTTYNKKLVDLLKRINCVLQ